MRVAESRVESSAMRKKTRWETVRLCPERNVVGRGILQHR